MVRTLPPLSPIVAHHGDRLLRRAPPGGAPPRMGGASVLHSPYRRPPTADGRGSHVHWFPAALGGGVPRGDALAHALAWGVTCRASFSARSAAPAFPGWSSALPARHAAAPFGFLTCTECDGTWPVRATVAALGFHGAPGAHGHLPQGRPRAAPCPRHCRSDAHGAEEASAWPAPDGLPRFDPRATDGVCFVPATAAAYARRGFDHMELVSRELCSGSGLALADVLVRGSARDQRELGREGRASNLGGHHARDRGPRGGEPAFARRRATTGASLAEATRALLARGAARVTACVLARGVVSPRRTHHDVRVKACQGILETVSTQVCGCGPPALARDALVQARRGQRDPRKPGRARPCDHGSS